MGSVARPETSPRVVRFGLYQVDFQEKLVHKGGIRVKVQNQPFQVLEALLEEPGQIVTREALRLRLWPEETPPEFDHRLNKAVNKLRTALGDSAENPRFIETLARQGYRFIAPVEDSRVAESTEEIALAATPVAADSSNRRLWGIAILAAALVVALTAALPLFRPKPAPQVSGYTQLTGDMRQKLDGLCSNGDEVFFVEFREGRTVLAAAPLSGGEPRLIPTTFDPDISLFVLDMDPSGDKVLLKTGSGLAHDAGNGELWRQPIAGGPAERLGSLVANDAKWSPDGRFLAYFVDQELYLAETDGSSPRLLIEKEGINSAIRWSPAGDRIRFRSGYPTADQNSIWEVSIRDSALRPVFPNWDFTQHCGAWTAGGTYFLFYSPSDFNLWIRPENAAMFGGNDANPVQLTQGPLRFRSPRLIPAGNRLVAIGEMLRGELLRWDSAVEQYVPHLYGLSADQLHYSADGRKLTYVSFPDNHLWVADADGSGRRQLTEAPMRIYLPRLSPNGQRIAFMGRMPGSRWKIHIIPVDGGAPEEVLPGLGPEADPNWSPDGQRLVFAPLPWETEPENWGVRILDLTTGTVKSLPEGEPYYSPRWSPDGRHIAAIRQDNSQLSLFDLETEEWSLLTEFQGGFPSWSRDAKHLYMFHAFTEERGIYRVRLADRRLEKVASLKNIDVAGTLGPFGLSMAANDDPVILRDRSVQEIYALDIELP